MKKKLFALLLSFAMLVNMTPPMGTVAAAAEDTGCEHHPVHTAECGYVEAVEGHDCGHICDESCQTTVLACVHTEHDATCGYKPAVAEIPEVPCNFAHSVELCGENEETCPHTEHDESCGYAPAVPGTAEVPCVHEHTEDCYTTVCSHQHDEACGYAEAVEGSPCTFVCPECSDRTELGDVDHIRAKLIERLYGSADGWVVCDFDSYTTTVGRHEGIDFACAPEAPIYAVVSGEIIAVSEGDETEPTSRIAVYSNDYDRTVFYFHADPMDTLTVGMWVEAGDLLGYEANRGSSDYHTHLELIPGRSELASISVNDDVLDNENPYPLWEEMLSESIADGQSAAVTRLYEAMYQETTLRGLFDLVNENTDALLGFDSEQVNDFEALILYLQEKNSPLTEDEKQALEQLLDDVDYLRDLLGGGTCPVCGEKGGRHTNACTLKDTWDMLRRSIPYADTSETVGSAFTSKTILTDDTGNHAIQIDAYSEGVVSVVPTEIVMIIDQSGSMYSAANGPNSSMTYDQFIGENGGDTSKGAQHMGYYVAVTKSSITSDWNGQVPNYRSKYVVALVSYSTDQNEWMCTPVYGIEEDHYKNLVVSPTYENYTELCANVIPLKDSVFYKQRSNTKIFKSLYGATIDGFYTFIQEVSGISNTKIAIVPFSTPRGYTDLDPDKSIRDQKVGGTGAFINGEFVHVTELEQTKNYAAALNPTDTVEGRAYIEQSMQAILTNYGGTCTEDGFKIANEIFASSENSDNPATARIVVCFTDGDPTVCSGDDATYNEYSNHEPFTAAIKASYKTKNTYNASVYVYGPTSLTNNAKVLLQYLSSDYPEATSFTDAGSIAQTGYSDTVGNDAALEQVFRELGQKIFEESNALDEESEIRDTVTPYFEIGGDYNGGGILVQQIPNSGELDADGNVIFDETKAVTLYDEANNIHEVTLIRKNNVAYDQTLSDGTIETRYGDQIIVNDYDYGLNTVYPGVARGAKLRLIIPIIPNDEFIGGDWSVTNSPDSGLFPDGNPNSPPVGGEDGYFPPPHVDVEVKEDEVIEANVEARAGATYLEEIPYEDVLKLVHLTIKDNDDDDTNNIVLQMGVPNFGVDEWKTDYVFIEAHLYDTLVDANGELILDEVGNPQKGAELKENENLSVRRDHAVIAEVYIWSRYTYVNGEAVLQEQRPEDLKPATGIINLTVYYPTFVFNDVTLYHGQPLSLATEAWGEEMDATPYLQWYTNEEYENLLANPQPRTESPGYVPLSEGSWGKDTEVVVQETPEVYFKVDPIDGLLENADAHIGPVDDHFYEKYDTVMGKDPINMNVRVFYTNDNHPDYDPDNPEGSDSNFDNAMRNAFFLHVDNKGNSILKHTSGSAKHENVYWMPEFKILPAYCELTIEKIGGLPNETYVFDIARGQTNEYSLMTGEKIQSETEPTYYTTVSITTDANGYGKVTLKELPVGVYTVTEDLDWSWRFKGSTPTVSWKYENGTAGTGTKIYLLGNTEQDTATVTVTNGSSVEQWLNGVSAVVKNIFGKGKQ